LCGREGDFVPWIAQVGGKESSWIGIVAGVTILGIRLLSRKLE